VKEGKSAAVGGLDFGKGGGPAGQFHIGKATPVNDTLVSPSTATVNADLPDRHYLPGMIGLALDRLESALAAAERAVRAAGMAKVAADEVNDQTAACELDAIVDAISDIPNLLEDAHQDLESIYDGRAPEGDVRVADAGDIEDNDDDDDDDDDDDVAGFLAISPSTPDSVIDGFITAVGADRVLGALDRLTAPAKADTVSN
jgi:hypothetical protein